jgi:hypothetical protein
VSDSTELDALRKVAPELADLLDGAQVIGVDPYSRVVTLQGPAAAWLRSLLVAVSDAETIRFVIDGGVRMSRGDGPWTEPVGRIDP